MTQGPTTPPTKALSILISDSTGIAALEWNSTTIPSPVIKNKDLLQIYHHSTPISSKNKLYKIDRVFLQNLIAIPRTCRNRKQNTHTYRYINL